MLRPLIFGVSFFLFRSTHEDLVTTHKILVHKLLNRSAEDMGELRQSLHADGPLAALGPLSGRPALGLTLPSLSRRTPLPQLPKSDYPYIRFWTKEEWSKHKNNTDNSSDIGKKKGIRGGTRASQGENVMLLFVEDITGTPVDGLLACKIRDHARSIWVSLYSRGMAPQTWGSAPIESKDEYYYEMEYKYPCLRYCEDHWKAHHVGQTAYSQWYRTYDKNMKAAAKREAKKRKIEDADDMDTTHPGIEPGDDLDDTGNSMCSHTSEDPQHSYQNSAVTSAHDELSIKDPLYVLNSLLF